MSDFDVIIVGGGIAGASLGAEIADKRRTLIVEAEDRCGYHTTGRSAAFWLAHYGGPEVMPLTLESGPLLEQGWPTGERSWLRRRGCRTLRRATAASPALPADDHPAASRSIGPQGPTADQRRARALLFQGRGRQPRVGQPP